MHLTFDDGPSEWTPAILDILAEHEVRATFFVVGQAMIGRSHIVKRIHAEGHELGNHTFTHPVITRWLTEMDDHDVTMELAATQELVELATGVAPKVWRAPCFRTDYRVNAIAESLGLEHVDATLIPNDWNATDPAKLAETVLSHLEMGSIVSLHDGIPPRGGSESCTSSRQPTVDALRLILAGVA